MKKIKELLKKHKSLIMYGIFGVLTTLVNIVSYHILYNNLQVSNVISTCIAWILSVLFAFITNKLFVFESKSFEMKLLLKEISSFFTCRFLTGLLDVGIMYVAVDVMSLNALFWKILSNVLVIIINYVLSKLIIFKKSIDK